MGERSGYRSQYKVGAVVLLWAAMAVGSGCNRPDGSAAPPVAPPAERAAVAALLEEMVTADQSARRGHRPVAEIDRRNTEQLKALYRKHGWFNIGTWGREADRNAWLLVQHASDAAFMKEILRELEKLWHRHETDPRNYAYLYDRVAFITEVPGGGAVMNVEPGRQQRYGTQGSCRGGRWEAFALERPERVDQLRASVGLQPLAEYQKMFDCK